MADSDFGRISRGIIRETREPGRKPSSPKNVIRPGAEGQRTRPLRGIRKYGTALVTGGPVGLLGYSAFRAVKGGVRFVSKHAQQFAVMAPVVLTKGVLGTMTAIGVGLGAAMAGVLALLVIVPLFLIFALYIINTSAYVVPPWGTEYAITTNECVPPEDVVTELDIGCPLDDATIICGSLGSSFTEDCPGGHGSNGYWEIYSNDAYPNGADFYPEEACVWATPGNEFQCYFNQIPGNVCNESNFRSRHSNSTNLWNEGDCPYYGMATDITGARSAGDSIKMPQINGEDVTWTSSNTRLNGNNGYGNYSTSYNGHSIMLRFGHVNDVPAEGSFSSGQEIGVTAPTYGKYRTPHLHYELMIDGEYVNSDYACEPGETYPVDAPPDICEPGEAPPEDPFQCPAEDMPKPTAPSEADILSSVDDQYAFPVAPYSDTSLNAGCGHHDGRPAIDIFHNSRASGFYMPVLAYTGGTIHTINESDPTGGKIVVLQGDDGRYYYYAHSCALYVSENQRVSAGEVIATTDRTGNAYGSSEHLHFAIKNSGPNFVGGGEVWPGQDFLEKFGICSDFDPESTDYRPGENCDPSIPLVTENSYCFTLENWPQDRAEIELQAIERLAIASNYMSKLCSGGQITLLFDCADRGYGGEASSGERTITFYSLGVGERVDNALFTLAHETGHIYARGSGEFSSYSHNSAIKDNGEIPICSYPLRIRSDEHGIQESFSEMIALYVAGPNPQSDYRDFSCLGGNMSTALPNSWEFARNVIFNQNLSW